MPAMRDPFPGVPDKTRRIMRSIRSNSALEQAIRSELHGRGYRFRKNDPNVPGRPDISFPSRKKAVLVHGCFWHQHEGCRLAKTPLTRSHYWAPKLARIRARDEQNAERLRARGWSAVVVWECMVKADLNSVLHAIVEFLGPARQPPEQRYSPRESLSRRNRD
jgi:DNA mismatch endonuclease, patch repair protein